MIIDFSPNGEVQAMHRDQFDLGFLGEKHIVRATEIRFSEETQRWSIGEPWTTRDDFGDTRPYPGADGFHTYEGARKIEVLWLDACRLEGVTPHSKEGLAALEFIRGTNSSDL